MNTIVVYVVCIYILHNTLECNGLAVKGNSIVCMLMYVFVICFSSWLIINHQKAAVLPSGSLKIVLRMGSKSLGQFITKFFANVTYRYIMCNVNVASSFLLYSSSLAAQSFFAFFEMCILPSILMPALRPAVRPCR